MLQRIKAVRGGGGGELRRQRLQLHHQAGVQGLQQGRLRLLLLQLQALHQLLQLRGKITERSRLLGPLLLLAGKQNSSFWIYELRSKVFAFNHSRY